MANVGILDVAKAAQVSVATVSRVINEPEKVGDKTQSIQFQIGTSF